MIIVKKKPGDPPWPTIEVDLGPEPAPKASGSESKTMSKNSFVPSKPILLPLAGEKLVSYGDRLLWHQLGLQMNGRDSEMLTEEEYIATVHGFYPEATESNVKAYRSYFNSRQATMGFREVEMPIHVEFAKGRDVSH